MEAIIILYIVISTIYTDYKYRKIYNKNLLVVLICSILFINIFLLWFIIGFLILYPIYKLNYIGAGDVKLLAVIGLIIGAKVILVFLCTNIIAGLFYICLMLLKINFNKSIPYGLFLSISLILIYLNYMI